MDNPAKDFGYSLKEALGTDEAAITPQQASQENLALYFNNEMAILYDWQYALKHLNDNGDDGTDVRYALVPAIKGFLSFGPSDQDKSTFEIGASAAEPGYGPLMYDLVMTRIYPRWLMSDRGSVSKSAFGVWQFYLKNRPDVEKAVVKDISDAIQDKKSAARDWGLGVSVPSSVGQAGTEKAFYALEKLREERDDIVEEWKTLKKNPWDQYFPTEAKWKQALARAVNRFAAINKKLLAVQNKISQLVVTNPLVFKYRTKRKAGSINNLVNKSKTFFSTKVPGWSASSKRETLEWSARDFFDRKYRQR